MTKLAAWIMRFRHHLLVGIVLLTIFFGYQLTKLKIDSDILNYLPKDDPVVVLFREIGDKFGGNSLAMVALETDDVFNYKTLTRIESITNQFQDLQEVSQVLSMTDILDIKKIPDGIEVGKLISRGKISQDPDELGRLREYCLSKEMYRGSLVSEDGRITLIIARLREGTIKSEVANRLKDIVKSTEGKEKIYYAGIPFQMVFLTDIITKDLMRLIPLVSLLVVLVLFFSFKSIRGVLLPLGTVMISTIWIIGLMSWLGIDLTIVTASIPILLIAIGSAYGIHLLSAHLEGRELYNSNLYHIQQTLKNIALPIILTGVTTLVGFLAFLFSYLTMTQQFGVFASLGVFFAMALSIVFIPVVLSYLPAKKKVRSKEGEKKDLSTKFMSLIANLVLSHEKLIITGGVLIIIAAIIAIPRLHREVNMVEYFKHDTEIHQAEDMMEKSFGGAIPVQILVSGDIKDPLILKAMFNFEKYLRSLPDINDPQSVADLIAELNEQMNGRHTIPDTREGVANLWFFIEGNKMMDQLVADNDTRALIQAKIGTVNSSRIITVVDSIDRHLETDVPRGLFRLKLSSLPEFVQSEVREKRIAEVARMISLDAEYHGADQTKSDRILSILKTVDSPEVQRLNPRQVDIVNQSIHDYFMSDAADIPIDSDHIIQRVVKELEPLFSTSPPDSVSIILLLQRQIPESMYEDDPEALEYAAFALQNIILEGRQQAIVEGLTDEVMKIISDVPETSSLDFQRDIEGNIWTLVENYAGYPSDQASTAMISEFPTKKPVEFTTLQTGMPIIFKKLDRSVLRSQALSLIVAMTLIFLLLAFRFRSFTGGLISLAPITGTILCNFILMSILGVPLDVVSILIGSVAVGIGIDYTIHFLTRFQKEFQSGKSEQEALRETLQTTGKAIIINATSVMMGFLVLVLGNIVPMQRFGYLIAITMVTSALGAITMLPALILVTEARFIGEFDRMADEIRQKVNGLKNFTSKE